MLSGNEVLQFDLIIHLNGRMLRNTPMFENFDIEFLTQLTFILAKETFSEEDYIFRV